jgi:recombination protein RecA
VFYFSTVVIRVYGTVNAHTTRNTDVFLKGEKMETSTKTNTPSGGNMTLGSNNDQKNKAIDLAVQAIEKQFGKGSIMRLGVGGALTNSDVQVVPTGSLGLDIALGIGGYPRGRIMEIYGPEASGKTTLTLHAIAEVQKQGGVAAFVDAEHALDVDYARKLGVRTDDLLISQPDTGEQALEIADMLVRSGGIDLLVVDSVAALVPRAEIEGEMGDSHMGLQARLMSQALRKLTGSINRSKTLVIFINQIRMKIGVMFGNPETTTGGNALKFYSSVRLDIRRIAAIKDGESVIGNRTRVKVVKNKMAPPFREVEFDILYGEGISKEGDILDLASNNNIIEKSGTWYTYKDERIGQGRDNARNYLKERPEMVKTIREEVLKKLGIGNKGAAVPAAGAMAAGLPSSVAMTAPSTTMMAAEAAMAAKAKATASAAATTKGAPAKK